MRTWGLHVIKGEGTMKQIFTFGAVLAGIIFVGMSTAAFAGPINLSVGVHGSLNSNNISCEGCAVDVDRSKGMGVQLGALVNLPNTPIKAGLVLAYDDGRNNDMTEDGENVGKFKSKTISLTPQVNFAVSKRVDVYARVGAAIVRAEVSGEDYAESATDRLAFTGGLGAEVKLIDHVSAYGEWNFVRANHTFGDSEYEFNVDNRANRASAGLRFTF